MKKKNPIFKSWVVSSHKNPSIHPPTVFSPSCLYCFWVFILLLLRAVPFFVLHLSSLTCHSLSLSLMASFSITSSPPTLHKATITDPSSSSSHAFPHRSPFVLRMPHQPHRPQTPLVLPKIQSLRNETRGFFFFSLFALLGFSCFKLLRSRPRLCFVCVIERIRDLLIWISIFHW